MICIRGQVNSNQNRLPISRLASIGLDRDAQGMLETHEILLIRFNNVTNVSSSSEPESSPKYQLTSQVQVAPGKHVNSD